MHDTAIHSNLDSLLVAIPFLVILLIGYFRLDELFASPKYRAGRGGRRTASTKTGCRFFAIRTASGGPLLGLFVSNREDSSWRVPSRAGAYEFPEGYGLERFQDSNTHGSAEPIG